MWMWQKTSNVSGVWERDTDTLRFGPIEKNCFVVWVKKVKSKWNYYLMKRKIDWWQTFEFMIKRKSIEYAYS